MSYLCLAVASLILASLFLMANLAPLWERQHMAKSHATFLLWSVDHKILNLIISDNFYSPLFGIQIKNGLIFRLKDVTMWGLMWTECCFFPLVISLPPQDLWLKVCLLQGCMLQVISLIIYFTILKIYTLNCDN